MGRSTSYHLTDCRELAEVCVQPPGFTEDAVVVTDPGWLTRWHLGSVTLLQAQRAGGMSVSGPRWVVQELTRWGTLSPFADIEPAITREAALGSAP